MQLPARPSLSLLKTQAKTLRKTFTAGKSSARLRVQSFHPAYGETLPETLSLRDAQLVIAREYDFENWAALRRTVETEAQKTDAQTLKANRIKTCTSSNDEIAQIVHKACGSYPAHAERITDHFSNEIQIVTTEDNQRVVYRANWYSKEPHFENERWALDQCAQIGVIAPQMIHLEHGLTGHPKRSVCVLTFLEGQALQNLINTNAMTQADYHHCLRQTGALYGKLHTVTTNGFRQLDANGNGPKPDWQSAYPNDLDRERLHRAAHNAEISELLIQEALDLMDAKCHLGNNVSPILLHGDFKPSHIMIQNGQVTGLIDFEHCEGGDPARELAWSTPQITNWWDAFTGHPTPKIPTQPILEGYRQTGTIDDAFLQRAEWFHLWGTLGGLAYHGVNDVNTAGMLPFLNRRFKMDLERAQKYL